MTSPHPNPEPASAPQDAGSGPPTHPQDATAGNESRQAAEDQLLARHGLVSTERVAAHYGIARATARRLLSDHGFREVRGYPAEVLNIERPGRHPPPGPGRGHRKPPPETDVPDTDQPETG